MSKQAFDKLMAQLPEEDKKNIYAAAAAYGLDFDSPEWIPFAISQHGLLSIQNATESLEKAIQEGTDHTLKEAMKALLKAKEGELITMKAAAAADHETIHKSVEAAQKTLSAYTAKGQADMLRHVLDGVERQVATIINAQMKNIISSQNALIQSIQQADERVRSIEKIKWSQLLIWMTMGSLLGGGIMVAFMWMAISSGMLKPPVIEWDAATIGQYIVDAMMHKKQQGK